MPLCTVILSPHSGQEHKFQIAWRLTHPESLTESHKASVGCDRSLKKYPRCMYLPK